MSNLYNELFGFNQDVARWVFVVLQGSDPLPPLDRIRLRDVFVEKHEQYRRVARIHTRMGGGNREGYAEQIDLMRLHRLYVSDEDCPHDSTYADFIFRIPEDFVPPLALKKKMETDPPDWEARWQKVIDRISEQTEKRRA